MMSCCTGDGASVRARFVIDVVLHAAVFYCLISDSAAASVVQAWMAAWVPCSDDVACYGAQLTRTPPSSSVVHERLL